MFHSKVTYLYYLDINTTIYLDGVIEFVASESSHVEKDFSQGISHSRFGTLQTFDKGFVALARRPRQIQMS